MSWEFKCLECGDCCKNLRSNKKFGLLLLPSEIDLFPHDKEELCLGKGISPNHPEFVIWGFQLIDDTCPHLFENRCTIYENRPMVCRAYPFKMNSVTATGELVFSISPECRALKKAIESEKYREGMASRSLYESEMAKYIGYWLNNFQRWIKKEDTPWLYNLEKKEWEVSTLKF